MTVRVLQVKPLGGKLAGFAVNRPAKGVVGVYVRRLRSAPKDRAGWKFIGYLKARRNATELYGPEWQSLGRVGKDSDAYALLLEHSERATRENPLAGGYSVAVVSANIEREVARGESPKQAAAMAYRSARAAWRKAHGRKALPAHLGRGRGRSSSALATNPAPTPYVAVLRRGRVKKNVVFHARTDDTARRYASGLLVRVKHPGWRALSLKRAPRAARARKNPSARGEAERAAAALEQFTGRPATVTRRRAPRVGKAGWELGRLAAISYIADRDGESVEYVHRFKSRSRPQLISSSDGKQLFMLGGAYSITDRGIEDRRS